MQHPPYNNSPIVEAVIGVEFVGSWPEDTPAKLKAEFKKVYAGNEATEFLHQFQAVINPRGVQTTASSGATERVVLSTPDDLARVRLALPVVSVHVLQPYPGWAKFVARAEEVYNIVADIAAPAGVREVAVRYIDRIALPASAGLALGDYFTAIPRRPERMPANLRAFQTIMEAIDPDNGTVARLTTAVVPPNEGETFVMVYDLNLVRRFQEDELSPLGGWRDVAEDLHERQYEIFKDSITEQTEQLFK